MRLRRLLHEISSSANRSSSDLGPQLVLNFIKFPSYYFVRFPVMKVAGYIACNKRKNVAWHVAATIVKVVG